MPALHDYFLGAIAEEMVRQRKPRALLVWYKRRLGGREQNDARSPALSNSKTRTHWVEFKAVQICFSHKRKWLAEKTSIDNWLVNY